MFTTEFRRSPRDHFSQIIETAKENKHALAKLREEKDYEAVRLYRTEIEKTFQHRDGIMQGLCGADAFESNLWALKMRLVRSNLILIDQSLAAIEKGEFNWDLVLGAMSFLDALLIATEQTLAANGE